MLNQQPRIFYKCETCLRESLVQEICHEQPMLKIDAGCAGDDCTKPISDQAGHLLSHAPKWWINRHRMVAH